MSVLPSNTASEERPAAYYESPDGPAEYDDGGLEGIPTTQDAGNGIVDSLKSAQETGKKDDEEEELKKEIVSGGNDYEGH